MTNIYYNIASPEASVFKDTKSRGELVDAIGVGR